MLQELGRLARLMLVILHRCANQDVGIGCDPHRLLAHPRFATLLISSIVSFRVFPFDKQPTKSPTLPSCAAALTTTRPSGSLSAAIFCPGVTPRCFKRSCFKVICPLAVTVSL